MCPKTVICLCVFVMSICSAIVDRRHRFTIESREDFTDTLMEGLNKLNFSLLYQITSSVYIFEYEGNGNAKHATELVINAFLDQIKAIEPTRIYNNAMKPAHASLDGNESTVNKPNLLCSNYYGIGVQNVWEKNITGKGVTIAICDVGLDTDLKNLAPNINKELSKNFFTNSSDVSPEYFPELVEKPPIISTHGNFIANVTASIKSNKFCSAGIAHDATLVGLKTYKITYSSKERKFNLSTDGEILARSLIYALDKIDIFVNAWTLDQPFDPLDPATKAAIKHGATKGRRGLGTVYVVPAGPVGNGLSNSIYTISVNSIDRFGENPADALPDASVLVSGLRDGNYLTASSMITTSHDDKRVRTFSSVSFAVAQVSGIIALGLQTNPSLTLRDIQHLLVQSAEYNGLDEAYAFRRNRAVRYYHQFFGFGVLNATTLVTLAKTWQKTRERLEVQLEPLSRVPDNGHPHEYKFCHSCTNTSKQPCLTVIEHVAVTLEFETYTEQLKMVLTSPSETRSVLTRKAKGLNGTTSGQLISVHFWDESAVGEWTFSLPFWGRSQTNVTSISLKLYGTNRNRKDFKSHKCGVKVGDKYHQANPSKQLDQPFDNFGPDKKGYLACICIILLILAGFVMRECRKMYFKKED